jgi:MFS family permease
VLQQTPDRTAETRERGSATVAAAMSPVSALLLSVAILLMGNGLQGTLVPVRANMEAFLPFEIGLIGTCYFLGFTLGCIAGPALVARVGHIRTFLAMTSLASALPLLHVLYVNPFAWCALRALTGFCFAVLYVVIESWINDVADNRTRGTIFSIYTMIMLTVITAGQMMLGLADPKSFTLFALASILVSLAAVPIAFTASSPSTSQLTRARPRLGRLHAISPVAFAGCFAVGLANGSLWALGPVFAQNQGLSVADVGFFMSAVVLGGAASQWPLGRLSDRMDRRIIMIGAATVCVAAALALMLAATDRLSMFAVGAVFGAAAFPLYPLAVAHANDNAEPSEYVEVSSGLLLLFGIGAAAGPLIASIWRQFSPAPNLFYFTAIVHTLLIGYVLWRMRRRSAAGPEGRVEFAEAAIAAQTVAPLDPVISVPPEKNAA